MIRDGTGKGYLVQVTSTNRLAVEAISKSLQHEISENKGQAYQVIGMATLASGTVISLHILNTSSTRNLVVTYIRHQIIDESGGTALPNASNYFRIAFNRTFSSGGSTVTPVNLNQGSGNEAEVTAYDTNPTLAGTAKEIDRWYTKAEADMNTFNKEGSIVIQPNHTMELAYIGDQTSGTLYTRLSFLMEVPD
ncbi:hypothetical protein LCGC14_1271620 [marine sediment metagenome]|uniref:Uncharacterized protein n=1 Tax=marine sediment metagenome TaxID=412755 RepID=A0A0F9KY03_9ZZZZ